MLIAMAVWDTEENRRTWMTRATLESLAVTVDWSKHRLIVVDNGSCKKTQELLWWGMQEAVATWGRASRHKTCPPFILIRNDENRGTANAINQALQQRVPGENCVKMDNDVVIHQAGWADWMEDVFARDSNIGICGLKRKDLLETPWSDEPEYKSTICMLPHEAGQRWLVVERVRHVIGTIQGYSSALLDKIGYLVQPSLYGFDDSLAAVRAKMAGFQSVFLHGFEIDHLDPGGDAYCQWKLDQAAKHFAAVNSDVVLYEAGIKDVYYNGL